MLLLRCGVPREAFGATTSAAATGRDGESNRRGSALLAFLETLKGRVVQALLASKRTCGSVHEVLPMSTARVTVFVLVIALLAATGASASGSASVAALQVALRANHFYAGHVDGVAGPLTVRGVGE